MSFDYEREVYRRVMDAADAAAGGLANVHGLTPASERAVQAALSSLVNTLQGQTDDQRRLTLAYLKGRIG